MRFLPRGLELLCCYQITWCLQTVFLQAEFMPPDSTHSMMIKFVFPTCSSPENTQTLSVTPEHRLTLDDITEYMKKSTCPWREALNVTFLYNGAAIKTGTLVKDMKLTFPSATINVLFSKRALPAGWSEHYDPHSGRKFYYCKWSRKSQWHFPSHEQSKASRDKVKAGLGIGLRMKASRKGIRAKTKAGQNVTPNTQKQDKDDEVSFTGSKTWEERDQELRKEAITVED